MTDNGKSAEKEPKTLKEKIDNLSLKFEKERFLIRVDELYYVLLTISIFITGFFISEYSSIVRNPLYSFPIIATIFTLLISFVIGLYGVIKDINEYRIYAWTLVVSCLFLTIMILILVVLPPQNRVIIYAILILIILLNILTTIKTKNWLTRVFESKKLKVKMPQTSRLFWLIVILPAFVIATSIIISLIIFLMSLT